MSLSSDIREYALSLGYDLVGFAPAVKFSAYEEDLTKRRPMYSWGIEGSLQLLEAADPRNILLEARSIVVVVYDYSKQSFPQALLGKIGRIYQDVRNSPSNYVYQERQCLLREFLKRNGCQVGGSTTGLPARQAGARAGVTNIGKNAFAFADGIGSFVRIETLVVDIELEYDKPTVEVKCPDNCTLCLEVCPTHALYEPFRVNPLRCVAYNSFATPGSKFGDGWDILPLEIRGQMGTWIHGCDVCQEICPRNQPRLKAKLPPNVYLEHIAGDFDLVKLLTMSDAQFDRVSTVLRHIKEKRFAQRNAAVALGNLREAEYVQVLAEAMRDPQSLVRGHAAWALGRIGGAKARQILETCSSSEVSKYVLSEIRMALD